MHDVIRLNRVPAASAVLRRLSHLSPDAMRFVLAVLAFRHLTGRTGIVRMSEIIRTHGIKPKSVIINELFDAGVMGQRDDGIVIYHPVIQAMMLPDNANPDPEEYGKPEGQPVLLFGKERLKDAPGRVNTRTRRVI